VIFSTICFHVAYLPCEDYNCQRGAKNDNKFVHLIEIKKNVAVDRPVAWTSLKFRWHSRSFCVTRYVILRVIFMRLRMN